MTRPTSFPRWASVDTPNGPGGQNNVLEPDETKKDIGWSYSEKPAREWMNYLQRLTYDWLVHLDDVQTTDGNVAANFAQDTATTTGLTFGYKAGVTLQDGQVIEIAAGTIPALTQSATNFIYVDMSTTPGTIASNTSAFPEQSLPLFEVTTSSTEITAVKDVRTFAASPNQLQNIGDTDSRLELNNNGDLTFISNNSSRFTVDDTGFTMSNGSFQSTDGLVSAPGITFANELDTGLYRSNTDEVSIACGGIRRLTLNLNGIDVNQNGDQTAPVYTMAGDSDTGMFQPAINNIGFSAGGAEALRVSPGIVRMLNSSLHFEDGTAANPQLAFANDTNTGLFRPSTDLIGIAAGGVEAARFGPSGLAMTNSGTAKIFNSNGSAAAPSYAFDSDNDTGFYRSGIDQLSVSLGGVQEAIFDTTGFTYSGSLISVDTTPRLFLRDSDNTVGNAQTGLILWQDSAEVASSYVGLASGSNNNFSINHSDDITFEPGGSIKGRWDSSGYLTINSTNNPTSPIDVYDSGSCIAHLRDSSDLDRGLRLQSGSVGNPAFIDTNSSAKSLSLGANGAEGLRITTASQVLAQDKSASTPAYSFLNDLDTGMFRESTNQIGFSVGGLKAVSIAPNAQFQFNFGTASTPILSFLGDSDTGIFRAATDTIGFSTGGVERMRLTSAGDIHLPIAAQSIDWTAGQAVFNSVNHFYFNLDSDNNGSSSFFKIGTNRTGTSGGTDLLTVTELGNLGLGTSSPSTLLHILKADAAISVESPTNAARGRFFGSSSNTDQATGSGNQFGGHIFFKNTDTTVNNLSAISNLSADGSVYNARILFQNLAGNNGSISFLTKTTSSGLSTALQLTDTGRALFRGGTVADPAIAFQADTDTGLYRASENTLDIVTGASGRVRVNSNGINMLAGGAIRLEDGDPTTPSLTFNNETTTGIRRPGAGSLDIIRLGSTHTRFTNNQIRSADGSASLPTFSFLNDVDSGMYSPIANNIAFACGGTSVMTLTPSFARMNNGLAFRIENGEPTSPSLRFNNDLNTGLYRAGADQIGFITGGVERVRITPSALELLNGTAFSLTGTGVQAFQVNSSNDYADILAQGSAANTDPVANAKGGGNFVLRNIDATGSNYTQIVNEDSTGLTNSKIVFENFIHGAASGAGIIKFFAKQVGVGSPLGEVCRMQHFGNGPQLQLVGGSLAAPSLCFGGINDGIYLQGTNSLGIVTAGTQRLVVNSSGISALTAPFVAASGGSSGAPRYTFGGDLNTGIYQSTNNQIDFSTAGIRRFFIAGTGTFSSVPFVAPNGSAGSPAITNVNDTDTGIYFPAADQIGFSVGGSLRLRISTTQLRSNVSGTAAAPFFTWEADVGTGIYRKSAGVVGVATNGTEKVAVGTTGLSVGQGSEITQISNISRQYAGYVDSNATAENVPAGMNVIHNGSGQYTFTHNLGTISADKICFVVMGTTSDAVAELTSTAANTFTYQLRTLDNIALQGAHTFMLTFIP